MNTTRILVLCTGNSCRSQMAEGLFRHYGGKSVEVFSAGLEPKGVNTRAVAAMKEIGIDISQQTSDHISQYINNSFDFVITVCDSAAERCPVFPGQGTKLHWPFEDPADASGSDEEIMSVFRQVRDKMDRKIKSWLAEQHIPA
jgi:arsenate reductase